MNINYIDIAILLLLLWGIYRGFRKGFIFQIATVAALAVGLWGAARYNGIVVGFAADKFEMTGGYVPFLSFILIFILLIILVHLIAKIIEKMVKFAAMSFLNRLSGAVFGAMKVALLVSVLVYFLEYSDSKFHFFPQDQKNKSIAYKPLLDLSSFLMPKLFQLKEGTNQLP